MLDDKAIDEMAEWCREHPDVDTEWSNNEMFDVLVQLRDCRTALRDLVVNVDDVAAFLQARQLVFGDDR